jgi:myo-inositol-1(or 4)-monophosphatase
VNLEEVTRLVIDAAREELLPRFTEIAFQVKADNSLVTEADLAVHRRLAAGLKALAPEVRFLSEEMAQAEQEALLAGDGAVWCLDPLDGTSNFVAGIPFFCVSLALLREGRPVLGIVYDPVRDECFTAEQGGGAQLNGDPLPIRPAALRLARAVAVVDLKRLSPPLRRRLAEQPPVASLRIFGSSALEWAWIAAGRGHLYLHGGQRLWDYAAGSLILAEAGGHSSTLQGEPVYIPAVTPRSVVASMHPELYDAWAAWLRADPSTPPN